MARFARVVSPGALDHLTQRGNGGARTFFSGSDYALKLRAFNGLFIRP